MCVCLRIIICVGRVCRNIILRVFVIVVFLESSVWYYSSASYVYCMRLDHSHFFVSYVYVVDASSVVASSSSSVFVL